MFFKQATRAKTEVKEEPKLNEEEEEAEEEKPEVAEPPRTGRKTIRVGKKIQPKLDRISDCLFWKVSGIL